jgi:hypothetical protein
MTEKYYILCYRIENKDSFLIWCSNDKDRVLTNINEKILNFSSKQELYKYALKNEINIEQEEATIYNIDAIVEWINVGDSKSIDCNEFNSAWNLFEDISRSVNKSFDSNKKVKKIYDKLFRGCNLPAVTPQNKRYVPEWDKGEVEILKNILSKGIQIFKESL